MSFTVKLVTVRPNDKVKFYTAYCQEHADTPGADARERVDAARIALGATRIVTLSDDKLTATTVTVWKDRAEYDQHRIDNAADIEAAAEARDAYMEANGLTMTVEQAGE